MAKVEDHELHTGTLAFIKLISTFLLVFAAWADPAVTFKRAVYVVR